MYPQSMFRANIREISNVFHLKIIIFTAVIYFSILHRRVFVIASEKLMAQEETEEVMHTERCSTLGLVRFCLTLCGISEGTVDSQIEIPVAKRKTFLTETSLTVRTWNKFLAIFLVATIAFLIGYFK